MAKQHFWAIQSSEVKEALEACKAIVFEKKEAGINAMIEFFNGLKAIDKQINDPFWCWYGR